uniref:transcription termination factor 4, mitochondrial-like isoform X2 n=1 Tax=Myxine glutinosa TaxID=7769 RepID=UPI00358FA83A
MIRKGLTLSCRTLFPTCRSTPAYCKISNASSTEELNMKLQERGFLANEVQEFLSMNSSLLKHVKPQKIFSILETLFELHPCNSTCLGALPICPDLLASSPKSIEQSATCLRKHGLMEDDLQRVVQTWPWVLLVAPRQIGRCIDTLRFDCEFTKRQQVLLLRGSPHLVCMEPKDVLDVFQLRATHREIVRCHLLTADLATLRLRHAFLLRRGLYSSAIATGSSSTHLDYIFGSNSCGATPTGSRESETVSHLGSDALEDLTFNGLHRNNSFQTWEPEEDVSERNTAPSADLEFYSLSKRWEDKNNQQNLKRRTVLFRLLSRAHTSTFLTQAANRASREEFDVFVKVFTREESEQSKEVSDLSD